MLISGLVTLKTGKSNTMGLMLRPQKDILVAYEWEAGMNNDVVTIKVVTDMSCRQTLEVMLGWRGT